MSITTEQLNFFYDSGYLIIDNFYPQEFADRFLSCIRRHANKDFAALIDPDNYEQLLKFDERPKSDLTLEEIKETNELCKEVAFNKDLSIILATIQSSDVVYLSSQMIFKEAHSAYSSQAWLPHQDNRYIDNKNGQYITANWFLRDSDPENGGIYVYPGSHKLPLLSAPDKQSFRENPDDNPGRECEIPEEFIDKKLDLFLKGNSLVVLHGNTIHGSYANNSDRSRPWYSTCYITKGEYFRVGKNTKRVPRDLQYE